MTMPIKIVIFDFDGTLVDTGPDICRATNDFLQLHGREPLSHAEITEHIGQGLTGLIQGVVPEAEHHPELLKNIEGQFSKIYDEYVLNDPRPFEGAENFLKNTPLKMAILSNKPERYIHLILKHLGWESLPWAAIVGGDTYAEKKPHPMPLMNILQKTECQPSEALMVGDGPPDVGVALATQCHLLAVSFGYSPIDELRSLGAEHWIGRFAELNAHLERL